MKTPLERYHKMLRLYFLINIIAIVCTVAFIINVLYTLFTSSESSRILLWLPIVGYIICKYLESLVESEKAFLIHSGYLNEDGIFHCTDEQEDKQGATGETDTSSIKTAYATLGIEPSVTNEEVKKAYRKLAMRYHPDHYTTQDESEFRFCTEKFQDLQSAYETICRFRGIR